MPRQLRYLMFGLLYFAQGAVLSYFTALNALYLLSFDLSMSQVGLVGAIGLIPFVLKIFMGILSDRVNFFRLGHRKPYILLGLSVQIICLLVVPGVNPGSQYWLFALLAFILMSGMALYDTCTDGLALDTTPQNEQGTIQGIMVAGRALGVVVISGVIGLLVERTSWSAVFYSLAVLSALPIPLVLLVREGERRPDQKFERRAFKAFAHRPIIVVFPGHQRREPNCQSFFTTAVWYRLRDSRFCYHSLGGRRGAGLIGRRPPDRPLGSAHFRVARYAAVAGSHPGIGIYRPGLAGVAAGDHFWAGFRIL